MVCVVVVVIATTPVVAVVAVVLLVSSNSGSRPTIVDIVALVASGMIATCPAASKRVLLVAGFYTTGYSLSFAKSSPLLVIQRLSVTFVIFVSSAALLLCQGRPGLSLTNGCRRSCWLIN